MYKDIGWVPPKEAVQISGHPLPYSKSSCDEKDEGYINIYMARKKGGDFVHGHEILGMRLNNQGVHIHQYSTQTTINDGLSHTVQGETSPAYNMMGHVHYY